jgi:hypothetical protein
MPTTDPDHRTHPELVRQIERDGSMPEPTQPLCDDESPWLGWACAVGAVAAMAALVVLVHMIVSGGWL